MQISFCFITLKTEDKTPSIPLIQSLYIKLLSLRKPHNQRYPESQINYATYNNTTQLIIQVTGSYLSVLYITKLSAG